MDDSGSVNGWIDVLIQAALEEYKAGPDSDNRRITYAAGIMSVDMCENDALVIGGTPQEIGAEFWNLLDAVGLNMGYCTDFPPGNLKAATYAALAYAGGLSPEAYDDPDFVPPEDGQIYKPLLVTQVKAASVEFGCCPILDENGESVGHTPSDMCNAAAGMKAEDGASNFPDQSESLREQLQAILEAINGPYLAASAAIQGIFVQSWGDGVDRSLFPPLAMPMDPAAYLSACGIGGDCNYRPLSVPLALEPDEFAEKACEFFDWEEGMYEPFPDYPYSLAVVGKSAQALLYCTFWGLQWVWEE